MTLPIYSKVKEPEEQKPTNTLGYTFKVLQSTSQRKMYHIPNNNTNTTNNTHPNNTNRFLPPPHHQPMYWTQLTKKSKKEEKPQYPGAPTSPIHSSVLTSWFSISSLKLFLHIVNAFLLISLLLLLFHPVLFTNLFNRLNHSLHPRNYQSSYDDDIYSYSHLSSNDLTSNSIQQLVDKHPPDMKELLNMDALYHKIESLNYPTPCMYGATVSEYRARYDTDAFQVLMGITYNTPKSHIIYRCVCPRVKYNQPNCYTKDEFDSFGTSIHVDKRVDILPSSPYHSRMELLKKVKFNENDEEDVQFDTDVDVSKLAATPLTAKHVATVLQSSPTHYSKNNELHERQRRRQQLKQQLLERYALIQQRDSIVISSTMNQDLVHTTTSLQYNDYLPVDKKFLSMLTYEGPFTNNDMILLSRILRLNQLKILQGKKSYSMSWLNGPPTPTRKRTDSTNNNNNKNTKEVKLKILFSFNIDKDWSSNGVGGEEEFERLLRRVYSKDHYYVIHVSRHSYKSVIPKVLQLKQSLVGEDRKKNILVISEEQSINAEIDPKAPLYMNLLSVVSSYLNYWSDWHFTIDAMKNHDPSTMNLDIDSLVEHMAQYTQRDLFIDAQNIQHMSRNQFVDKYYDKDFKKLYKEKKDDIETKENDDRKPSENEETVIVDMEDHEMELEVAEGDIDTMIASNLFYRMILSAHIGVDMLMWTRWTTNPSGLYFSTMAATLTSPEIFPHIRLLDGRKMVKPRFVNRKITSPPSLT